MAEPLTLLYQRLQDDWLVGGDSQQFADLAQQRIHELQIWKAQDRLPTIVLAIADPVAFLAGFMAAVAMECPIFLGYSHWGEREWQQVGADVRPDLIWSDRAFLPSRFMQDDFRELQLPVASTADHAVPQAGWIMIPTGGSSGKVRFAIHTWATLTAAVDGFRQFFCLQEVNSCCVLPLYHVSGLMQFIRSFTSGGRLAIAPFKQIEAGQLPDIDPCHWFLSLVPTQLHRLLQSPGIASWLSQFQTVLLGGAPAWAKLLDLAQQHQIRLAPTFGMTEVASQATTLKPDLFLNGHRSSGHPLPHVAIQIINSQGQILAAHQIGSIQLQARSLALGYFGDRPFSRNGVELDDLGFLDDQGELQVVGRSSDKIITGGENVFPAEVEAAIRATELIEDVCVFGMADAHWGEVVAAACEVGDRAIAPDILQTALQEQLSRYKQPKHWFFVPKLPRNLQGKINRDQVKQMVTRAGS